MQKIVSGAPRFGTKFVIKRAPMGDGEHPNPATTANLFHELRSQGISDILVISSQADALRDQNISRGFIKEKGKKPGNPDMQQEYGESDIILTENSVKTVEKEMAALEKISPKLVASYLEQLETAPDAITLVNPHPTNSNAGFRRPD
jgi:hypothetical protein